MAHLSLHSLLMRRSKLILAFLTLAALLWPARAESPVQARGSEASAHVRVEHQLIHVMESSAPVRRPTAAGVNRLASVRKPVQRARSEGLVARAGRLLAGNGRYRPEPFPRPGR
jgi:hypothetical protein